MRAISAGYRPHGGLLQRAPTPPPIKKPTCAVAEMGFENSLCSATGQPAALSFEFSHHQLLFSRAFMGPVLPP